MKLGASGPVPTHFTIINLFSRLIWKRRSEREKNRIYNSKIRFCSTALFTPSLLLCNLVKHEFQGNRPLHLASFQSNFQFITIIYAMSWWFSIKYLLIMWHMLINHALSLSLTSPRVFYDFTILFAQSYCLLVFVNSQFAFFFVGAVEFAISWKFAFVCVSIASIISIQIEIRSSLFIILFQKMNREFRRINVILY